MSRTLNETGEAEILELHAHLSATPLVMPDMQNAKPSSAISTRPLPAQHLVRRNVFMLQSVAACCSMLQYGAVWCSMPFEVIPPISTAPGVLNCVCVWQSNAVCCRVLCSLLQCIAVCHFKSPPPICTKSDALKRVFCRVL